MPFVGAIIVLNESKYGHLAYVVALGDKITIKESNYISCEQGQRQLDINDPTIMGYY